MKHRLIIFNFVFLILVSLSCSSQKGIPKDAVPYKKGCEPILLLETSPDSLPSDPFTIETMQLVNDCLEINLTYGGGCGQAVFKLYYTNLTTQSMPPQTKLYLSFEDKDPCRSIVTRKLVFNLDPLRELAGSGGVYLKIGNQEVLFERK